MGIDYALIGERIRDERKKQGLTQEEIADEIDVSVVFMSRAERGETKINLNRLAQICTVLGVPLEKMITGTSFTSENYLDDELYNIIIQCSPAKQRLIYNIAKIVLNSKFV